MSDIQSIELIIIGAGPAGLSTAMHLVQRDPSWAERMLVLEKDAHPRHKLCGGGVTRLGMQELAQLGLGWPLPLPQAIVEDVRLVYRERTVHIRGKPQVAIFQRAELDAYLAVQACQRGVKILENEAVKQIAIEPDGVMVMSERGSYRAKALVGADGSKGATRQLVSKLEGRTRVARLLEVVHPAAETAPHFGERYAVFDFSPAQQNLQGYTWDFPARVGEQAAFNRGVYDARVALDRPKAALPEILEGALGANGVEPQRAHVQGHPIHWFSPGNRFSMPRLLLVGDAAGAEPLFGEGIGPALGYGRVAADAVQSAFQRGDFSFRDYRSRLRASYLGRYLMVRWASAWLAYRMSGRAWFMQGLWAIGGALARLWPAPKSLY